MKTLKNILHNKIMEPEEIQKIIDEIEFERRDADHRDAEDRRDSEEEEEEVGIRLDDPIECMKIQFPATVLIIGISETGKTTTLKNIIYINRDQFHRIWLLAPFADKPIYDFIPKKYRITDPTDADLETIFQEQQMNPDMKTCIICDDCIGRINFARGKISKMLAATGRHANVSFIIVNQYLNDISPIVRDNAKVLFITKVKSHCVDTVFKLSGAFSSKMDCMRFLHAACQDYRVVRFNLTGYHKKEYSVFKSFLPRKFKLNY